MQSPFHYLRFRAFAHETEDVERVKAALRQVAQFPNIQLEEDAMEGSHGNRIRLLEGDVKANPRIQALFAALWRDDADGAARLMAELPRRIDENGNLFFRLDKQEAYMGRVALATSDDAIQVRGKLRSEKSKQTAPGHDLLGFLGEIESRSKR